MIQSRHGDRANGRTRVPGISGAAQSRNERKPSPVDSLTLSPLPSSTVNHSITITLYHPLHFDARDVSAHARDWPFCSPSRPRSLPHAAFPSLREHPKRETREPSPFQICCICTPPTPAAPSAAPISGTSTLNHLPYTCGQSCNGTLRPVTDFAAARLQSISVYSRHHDAHHRPVTPRPLHCTKDRADNPSSPVVVTLVHVLTRDF